ncbi:MAG: trypsin-like peptidase domain-containing protein [Firmicutes bacterium]|nr:trypsin-like peptidase domain-containing protein [Bacillota bacterium]
MSEWNPFEPQSSSGAEPPAPPPGKKHFSAALRAFLAASAAAAVVLFGSLIAVLTAPPASQPGTDVSSAASREPASSFGSASQPDPGVSSTAENINVPEFTRSPPPQGAARSAQETVKKVRSSIVAVMVYEPASLLTGGEPIGISEGSGIIMTPDGYLLTNAHVIDSRSDVYLRIVLLNGEELPASVVGYDTRTDLAVLKAETNGQALPAAEFGDSDACEVGDTVLAFGNPGGVAYANSVTKGILSATNRFVSLDINSLPLLQTDAAINPGNSGGALVNTYGQVIGINSAKVSGSDYEGMGFAIPTAQAKPIIDKLLRYGRVTDRVRLGIRFSAVSELDASLYQVQPGMQITYLADNSVFSGTDVQENDIITAIDGTSVKTVTGFFALLDEYTPGQTVEITLYRPKSEASAARTFTVSVQLQPEN